MASQDDLGLLWYGVSGPPFTTTDSADVLLNTGPAPNPLLSDHPRPLLAQQTHLPTQPQIHALGAAPTIAGHLPHATCNGPFLQPGITTLTYADPTAPVLHTHTQMMYDASTGDYITPTDYMYESLESYDDDSTGAQSMLPQPGASTPAEQANQQLYQEQDEPIPAPKTKKPKVHHHPALKLKTPIAYQKDTDLSAIPIIREGMAVCEKCGAIGVKHAFYGKERKFCSLSCARPSLPSGTVIHKLSKDMAASRDPKQDPLEWEEVGPELETGQLESMSAEAPSNPSSQQGYESPASATEADNSSSSSVPMEPYDNQGSFEWTRSYLNNKDFKAAPVKLFHHAPMSECWDSMTVGLKVEVSTGAESVTKDTFWLATVVNIAGYKACLRFEGMEGTSKDFWVDLCSEEVHPVGWCASENQVLIPPRCIEIKYTELNEFLLKRLTGALTLPSNFHSKVLDSHKSRFRPGLNVEVVDKNRIAQMRVATVVEVVGKRLHLRYHGAAPHDDGFWCHEDSPIIHHVGWSREIGHDIVASEQYHERCQRSHYTAEDAPPSLFLQPSTPAFLRQSGSSSSLAFSTGMKLEAIDPLNLGTICVATVMKVLRNNYLMVRIDTYESDGSGSDWFCYHATSPCIFPPGFCHMNNIPLTPPKGYEGDFSWFNYLKSTSATAAPPALFNREASRCSFEAGMSLEAADLMDPRLVCVATVRQVHGRLLRVHFDGWEDDFDQWVDAQSCDIYPVGWSQMVGYKLEAPRGAGAPVPPHRRKARRGVGRRRRGGGAPDIEPATLPEAPAVARRGRPFRAAGMSSGGGRGRRGRPAKRGSLAPLPQQLLSADLGDSHSDDDTSSGVASLAESDNCSLEAWPSEDRNEEMPCRNVHNTTVQACCEVDSTSQPTVAASEADTKLSSQASLTCHEADSKPPSDSILGCPSLVDETSLELFPSDTLAMSGFDEPLTGFSTPAQAIQLPPVATPNSWLATSTSLSTAPLLSSSLTGIPTPAPPGGASLPSAATLSAVALASPSTDGLMGNGASALLSCTSAIPTFTYVNNNAVLNTGVTALGITSNPLAAVSSPVLLNGLMQTDTGLVNDGSLSAGHTYVMQQQQPLCIAPEQQQQVFIAPEQQQQQVVLSAPAVLPQPTVVAMQPVQPAPERPFIPRLVDAPPLKDGSKVQPKQWTVEHVAQFLTKNDCSSYSEKFVAEGIDGAALLALHQQPNLVMSLTGMKVGPSLKIQDLIKQLVALVNPAHARYQATLLRRGLAYGNRS